MNRRFDQQHPSTRPVFQRFDSLVVVDAGNFETSEASSAFQTNIETTIRRNNKITIKASLVFINKDRNKGQIWLNHQIRINKDSPVFKQAPMQPSLQTKIKSRIDLPPVDERRY